MKVSRACVLPLLVTGAMGLSTEVKDILDMVANSAEASSGFKHSLESVLHSSLTTMFNEFETFSSQSAKGKASEYPYFGIIPPFQASLLPGAGPSSWSSACFASTSGSLGTDGTLSITAEGDKQCENREGGDLYLLGSIASISIVEVTAEKGVDTIWSLPANFSESEEWDLENKGVRVFLFQDDGDTLIANLLKTLELFIPVMVGPGVGKVAAANNVQFMKDYANKEMLPNPTLMDPPPADQVKSGDFFGVIRLDGLDPMLAWAMGSTTGHTTVALWIDGELYICESTAASAYWSLSGIQKTPYAEWLTLAQAASYNVVWMPLNDGVEFDEAAAVSFFQEWEGVDYGYQAMLFGWLDTVKDNYPCLPPDFSSSCLQWELVEVLFAFVDRADSYVSNQMWNQALNKRLNTEGLNFADLMWQAELSGIDSRALPMVVEQDDWMYETLNITSNEIVQAPAMVCNVFVCHTWKAGGLFGASTDNMQCGETTNWDIYVLEFLNAPNQVLGEYTLNINNASSKNVYDNYAETCASLAPNYYKDPNC